MPHLHEVPQVQLVEKLVEALWAMMLKRLFSRICQGSDALLSLLPKLSASASCPLLLHVLPNVSGTESRDPRTTSSRAEVAPAHILPASLERYLQQNRKTLLRAPTAMSSCSLFAKVGQRLWRKALLKFAPSADVFL